MKLFLIFRLLFVVVIVHHWEISSRLFLTLSFPENSISHFRVFAFCRFMTRNAYFFFHFFFSTLFANFANDKNSSHTLNLMKKLLLSNDLKRQSIKPVQIFPFFYQWMNVFFPFTHSVTSRFAHWLACYSLKWRKKNSFSKLNEMLFGCVVECVCVKSKIKSFSDISRSRHFMLSIWPQSWWRRRRRRIWAIHQIKTITIIFPWCRYFSLTPPLDCSTKLSFSLVYVCSIIISHFIVLRHL